MEYVLIGGMAAALHGSDVATFDLDVTPRTTPENLTRLSSALVEIEATIRTGGGSDAVAFDPDPELLARMKILNLSTKYGDVDIVVVPAGSSGYEDLVRDARTISIHGVNIAVAALTDVIRSKEAADRPKDRAVLPTLKRLEEESSER